MTSERLSERYAPRAAGFLRAVSADGGVIKLNGISTSPDLDFTDAETDAAAAVLEQSQLGKPHLKVGFAVLHRGEEALWLLLHWWLDGGIASHAMWRAGLGTARPEFSPVPAGVLACVWELGVIDFERRAFMDTALSGAPLADYLASRMPRSTV
ncbi:hypothetical protein [Martelella mangrovi]|uniref:Uncharacterized protein n=1 Tax=Martelella mangrovi TaxID=1397477 RepID=A0ABV2I5X2_9HYPH